MSRKNVGIACVAIVSLLIIAGCGDSKERSAVSDDRPTVALVMKSLANEFFVNMANGAKQHQLEHAHRYNLIVSGLKDESDLTQQVALIEQMSARGVDVIVVAPADSKALIPVKPSTIAWMKSVAKCRISSSGMRNWPTKHLARLHQQDRVHSL